MIWGRLCAVVAQLLDEHVAGPGGRVPHHVTPITPTPDLGGVGTTARLPIRCAHQLAASAFPSRITRSS